MLGGIMEEAVNANAEAWKLKTHLSEGGHDMTSARILFARITLQWLLGQDPAFYLGQLRTLLANPNLPCFGGINAVWDAADILEGLRPKLTAAQIHLLEMLVEVMNRKQEIGALEQFDLWKNHPPAPLETPWPEHEEPV